MPSRAERTEALDQALYGSLEEFDGGKELTIIGIDEVGRGSLSGPLTVAAVILPLAPRISGLNDSKKLSAVRREALSAEIHQIANSISIIDIAPEDIDQRGISLAVRTGMQRALEALSLQVERVDLVLIDGNPLSIHPKEMAVVKGDGKVATIAAASIVAKVHRDALMVEYSAAYPVYGWESNKGYGSLEHRNAIKEQGLSPLHRRSFCEGIVQESLF